MPPVNEIYSYQTPWLAYGLSWCNDLNRYRLALGSFQKNTQNKIQIIDLNERLNRFELVAEVDQTYPSSKVEWCPFRGTHANLFASSGESLKLWEMTDNGMRFKADMVNAKRAEGVAPLTSMDWNTFDPTMIAVSSVDTTCTIWNIETQQMKMQLIAHDREVNDVSFSNSPDIFGSVGADGSLRMFDLRNLEHSTILYDTADGLPLVRLMWNKMDPNYISTIKVFNPCVQILDIRMPCVPIAELKGHKKYVNHCAWSPRFSTHICTVGEDGQALVWDIATNAKVTIEPSLAYQANGDICQVSWSQAHSEWVGIIFQNTVQILRI